MTPLPSLTAFPRPSGPISGRHLEPIYIVTGLRSTEIHQICPKLGNDNTILLIVHFGVVCDSSVSHLTSSPSANPVGSFSQHIQGGGSHHLLAP